MTGINEGYEAKGTAMPGRRRYGVELTREEFRRGFPKLAEEMENGVMRYSVSDVECKEEDEKSELRGPDAVSYLRRCSTLEEAEEIIAYLERKGEINPEYADSLRREAHEGGVAAFGEKKEQGYYFRKYWTERDAFENE
ncbi:MAG: DUF2095 family protein [Candidatus Bathyarchaeia archaeon]